MNKKETKAFWAQAEANAKEVQTWPRWMQRMVITAESAASGNFVREDRAVEREKEQKMEGNDGRDALEHEEKQKVVADLKIRIRELEQKVARRDMEIKELRSHMIWY